MSVLHDFDQCSPAVSFEIKKCDVNTPTSFFFFGIVLAILGPLNFHMDIRVNLAISAKNSAGSLTGTTLTLTSFKSVPPS